jgi:hypothetical protein
LPDKANSVGLLGQAHLFCVVAITRRCVVRETLDVVSPHLIFGDGTAIDLKPVT